jgi:formylglycine-generating enzyme required for sulfatase activity
LYFHGDNPEGLSKIGNVADATLKARFDGFATIKAKDGFTFTAPVGNFRPNSFGLFDTHGNVWEWCSDWYGEYSNGRTVKDPTGPAAGSRRVIRGGGWSLSARSCRSAIRRRSSPEFRYNILGFRVLRSSIK